MRFVILHYHFLKNAGMSIESILHRSFGSFFCSIDTEVRDGHIADEALLDHLRRNPLLKAVSSHQIRYPVPCVPAFLFFDLCFLRDPMDRIRSTYDYFREKPSEGDPVSDFANQLSLGEFVASLIRDMPWCVHDAQVNLLANGIVNDVPAPGDFERAAAKMLRTSFLGVVDRFNESLIAGQHFLRPVFPTLDCAAEAENVSGGLAGSLEQRVSSLRDACDPIVYAELVRMNACDLKLLELARAEVERRFRVASKESCR
jgi:hypothetical protein